MTAFGFKFILLSACSNFRCMHCLGDELASAVCDKDALISVTIALVPSKNDKRNFSFCEIPQCIVTLSFNEDVSLLYSLWVRVNTVVLWPKCNNSRGTLYQLLCLSFVSHNWISMTPKGPRYASLERVLSSQTSATQLLKTVYIDLKPFLVNFSDTWYGLWVFLLDTNRTSNVYIISSRFILINPLTNKRELTSYNGKFCIVTFGIADIAVCQFAFALM